MTTGAIMDKVVVSRRLYAELKAMLTIHGHKSKFALMREADDSSYFLRVTHENSDTLAEHKCMLGVCNKQTDLSDLEYMLSEP